MARNNEVAPARMTQLHLAILMHCNAINEPYAMRHPEHANSSATKEYTAQLLDRELIRPVAGSYPEFQQYITTEKGRDFCGRILSFASDGAPSSGPVVTEPRLRDNSTFLDFFGTLRLPGWVWLFGALTFVLWR